MNLLPGKSLEKGQGENGRREGKPSPGARGFFPPLGRPDVGPSKNARAPCLPFKLGLMLA